MTERITPNTQGHCPYDGSSAFIAGDTVARRPGQVLMRCAQCGKWSCRQRGIQYPLQNPAEKTSPPTTAAMV